jgi:hypothetical protein
MFPLQDILEEEVLLQLLFNFASEYASRKENGIQEGLRLKGTYQLPVYADGVNLLEVTSTSYRIRKML